MAEYSGRYPRGGIGNVGSYQVAGIPFLTGTTVPTGTEAKIAFQYVAKSVTVVSTSAQDIRVHFNSLDDPNVITGSHYISLVDNKDSMTFTNKCSEIYVSCPVGGTSGTFELYAELTSIPASEMLNLTGSGLTE